MYFMEFSVKNDFLPLQSKSNKSLSILFQIQGLESEKKKVL